MEPGRHSQYISMWISLLATYALTYEDFGLCIYRIREISETHRAHSEVKHTLTQSSEPQQYSALGAVRG